MYRRYRIPSMWRELDRLQREMDKLFNIYYPDRLRPALGFPAVNIWASKDSLVVTAEVPGVSADDIEINVVGETLTLSGNRRLDEVKEGARYHRQERGHGKFSRSIQLPFPVEVNKVEATFKNGVLSINLPRAEADKPRKIVVKSK